MAEEPDNYSKYVLLIVGIVVASALIALLAMPQPTKVRYGYPTTVSKMSTATPTTTLNPCPSGGAQHTGICNEFAEPPDPPEPVAEGVLNCNGDPFLISVVITRIYSGVVCEDACNKNAVKQDCESGGWGGSSVDDLAKKKCEDVCWHLGDWITDPYGDNPLYVDCTKKDFIPLNPKLFQCAMMLDYVGSLPPGVAGPGVRCTQKKDTCTHKYKCTCKRGVAFNPNPKKEESISGGE